MASSEVEELRKKLREVQRDLREANRELLDQDEQLLEACAREEAALEQAAQAEEENAWLTEMYHLMMQGEENVDGSVQDKLEARNKQLAQTAIVIARLKGELQKLRDTNQEWEAKYTRLTTLRGKVEEKAEKLQKEMADLAREMSKLSYGSTSKSSSNGTDN